MHTKRVKKCTFLTLKSALLTRLASTQVLDLGPNGSSEKVTKKHRLHYGSADPSGRKSTLIQPAKGV